MLRYVVRLEVFWCGFASEGDFRVLFEIHSFHIETAGFESYYSKLVNLIPNVARTGTGTELIGENEGTMRTACQN